MSQTLVQFLFVPFRPLTASLTQKLALNPNAKQVPKGSGGHWDRASVNCSFERWEGGWMEGGTKKQTVISEVAP